VSLDFRAPCLGTFIASSSEHSARLCLAHTASLPCRRLKPQTCTSAWNLVTGTRSTAPGCLQLVRPHGTAPMHQRATSLQAKHWAMLRWQTLTGRLKPGTGLSRQRTLAQARHYGLMHQHFDLARAANGDYLASANSLLRGCTLKAHRALDCMIQADQMLTLGLIDGLSTLGARSTNGLCATAVGRPGRLSGRHARYGATSPVIKHSTRPVHQHFLDFIPRTAQHWTMPNRMAPPADGSAGPVPARYQTHTRAARAQREHQRGARA
jgi:hypothetical protein